MVALLGIWAVGIVLLLRWFHVVSTMRSRNDGQAVAESGTEAPLIYTRLSSSIY